jgi:hypothetical protein
MALIQLGPLAAQVSGSIGGTVFAHNRGGAYARTRVVPRKVENLNTLAVRDALSTASRAWGGLTEAQRQAWREFSTNSPVVNRLGMSKTLAGHMAFNKIASRLLLQGLAILTLPPVENPPAALTGLSIDLDATAGTAVVTFAPTPIGADKHLWLWSAMPAGPGAQYVANKWRLIHLGVANAPTGTDVWDDLLGRYGDIQVGQAMAFQAQVFDASTGLVSSFLPYVTAAV